MATPWLRRFTGPLLPPAWREASVEERLRGSLFVVGCLAMASIHVWLAAVLWASLGLSLVVGAVAAGAAAMIVAVALFRWTGSLRGPGVLVLATMISALTAVAAHSDGSLVLWTPWWAVFPPLANYLIGRRAGWAVAGVVLVDMALLAAAHAQGLTLPGGALGDREVVPVSWLAHGSGVFAVAILVALYDRLRDEAREELQDALHWARDSERRLATLVHQTDDMICALDDGLRITAVNRAFLELLGIVVDPVVGKRLIDVLPPGDRRRWGERFARALRGASERVVDSHGMGATGPTSRWRSPRCALAARCTA